MAQQLLRLLRESLWQSFYWNSPLTAHYDRAYVAKRRAECREDVGRMFEIVHDWLNGRDE